MTSPGRKEGVRDAVASYRNYDYIYIFFSISVTDHSNYSCNLCFVFIYIIYNFCSYPKLRTCSKKFEVDTEIRCKKKPR